MADNSKDRKPPAKNELWRLCPCYTGCMLGLSLSTVGVNYARDYGTHRRRMLECLTELGAKVPLPKRHKDFSANRVAIQDAVIVELDRVSSVYRDWTAFGCVAIDYAVKRAVGSSEAARLRRAVVAFMDRVGLPRAFLTKLVRACRRKKDGTLSLNELHSAALAMLNEIIARMKRENRTAFVAMPFSVPRMIEHYASFYAPLVKNLECQPLRAWGGFGTEDYQDLLYTLIDRCGVMVADITTLNPNVMHELGYALGRRDKFIVLIAEEGEPVPANLGDLTVLPYRAKGDKWQRRAVVDIALTVLFYKHLAAKGAPSRRIVGPIKVTP